MSRPKGGFDPQRLACALGDPPRVSWEIRGPDLVDPVGSGIALSVASLGLIVRLATPVRGGKREEGRPVCVSLEDDARATTVSHATNCLEDYVFRLEVRGVSHE